MAIYPPWLLLVALLGATDAKTDAERRPPVVFGAYAETFYQWNFNVPSNGITNYRGFDNRHNTFSIANVALDARWDWLNIVGRATLQVGLTPSTYYLSEPSHPGTPATPASNAELWKYIQQAYAGYRIPLGQGLLALAGVFLSPTGPESMVVHDNWNWSRSTLFVGLPFYHTGLQLAYPLTDRWWLSLAVYNGWNSVIDNNVEKSISGHATYTANDQWSVSMLYIGGVERPTGAPEGRAWRHLFDGHVLWQPLRRLQLLAHATTGFEPNNFGVSAWIGGALYARGRLHDMLFAAVRVDALREFVARNASGQASPIFYPVPWVASATATLDFVPVIGVSIRLEYRHDQAAGNLYFRRAVGVDETTLAYIPNARSQDTLTLGVTTWF